MDRQIIFVKVESSVI